MLSTATRLKLQDIADRIASHEPVSFEEMQWATKWSQHNHAASEIIGKARRRAALPKSLEGGIDEFMCDMNLGEPDPSDHLIGPQSPEDLYNWFRKKRSDDWRQRD